MPKIIKIDWFFTELFINNRWSLFARHREGVTALTKMVLTMRERCISAPMNVPAQPITVCCSIYTNNSHTHTASRVISSGDTRPTTDHNPNPIYPKLTLTDRGEGILQTGDVASWKECRQYASEFCQTCRQLTPTTHSMEVVNHTTVTDATIRQPGFDLPRYTWSLTNRCSTGQGPCLLTCTNGVLPNHLSVTVVSDRPWTTLLTRAH